MWTSWISSVIQHMYHYQHVSVKIISKYNDVYYHGNIPFWSMEVMSYQQLLLLPWQKTNSNYRIYLNRSPGVLMIFDPVFKPVRCLFKLWHWFPIVHLSRVEWKVLVPVFTSLIAWLETNTFIKVHGLHSLTKRVSTSCGKTTNVIIKYAVNDRL